MKVCLVVAAGAHEGRVIPVTGAQFLIGRDQQCHLRPASQAISKLHCAVIVRNGAVYIKDFGSTNGTMVNEVLVQGMEVAVSDGASVRVGPLDFKLRVEAAPAMMDGTPLPADTPESAAAIAAVKAATGTSKAPPSRDTTPAPVKPSSGIRPSPASGGTVAKAGSGTKPALGTKPAAPTTAKTPSGPPPIPASVAASTSKEVAAPKSSAGESTPSMATSESVSDEDQDRIAAMLLGMDESGNNNVPDGSTVMDLPNALTSDTATDTPKAPDSKPEKKDDKKPVQTREEMSTAANDLLRKYMRRPK